MASDNLDPNIPDDDDYLNADRSTFRFVAAPTPETVKQYKQRKAELSAREQRVNKVAKRVGLVAKLFALGWVITLVGAIGTGIAIAYVVLHFVAKHW